MIGEQRLFAKRPALGQLSPCHLCNGAAYTRTVTSETRRGAGELVTEEVVCHECGAESTYETPGMEWPAYSQITEVRHSMRHETPYGSPPWRLSSNPPAILCSSCGEVLEKADDCYRCKCGREVRP